MFCYDTISIVGNLYGNRIEHNSYKICFYFEASAGCGKICSYYFIIVHLLKYIYRLRDIIV